jgi:malonyl-CoA/methylmalonyl-CoA synthetase
VVAVVVPRASAVADPQAIGDALTAVLAGYKRPKLVLMRKSLPRNAMGKVEKAALRRELASVFTG